MDVVITIDGPAGSGKSSIARFLAKRTNFTYLNTGMIYRAITHICLKENISYKVEEIKSILKKYNIEIDKESIFINKEDVTDQLRTDQINKSVPFYAQNSAIRNYTKILQKRIFTNKNNIIVDGRDIGTVVFPNAFCKFYLDADTSTRAKRRLDDEKEDNSNKNIEEITAEISERDRMDKTRKESPLKIPKDSCYIDSSNLSVEEVLEKMVDYFNKQVFFFSLENNIPTENTEVSDKTFVDAVAEMSKGKQSEVITATVISINKEEILLDIGQKKEGIIPAKEFSSLNLEHEEIEVGKEIQVFFIEKNQNGDLVYSYIEAKKRYGFTILQEAFDNKQPIQGTVAKVINKGFQIYSHGVMGFCPYSEYDIKRVDSEEQLNKVEEFELIEYSPSNRKIIFSRKKIVQKKYEEVKREYFQSVSIGEVITVKAIIVKDNYVIVEVVDKEGVTAFLGKENISWAKIKFAKDEIKKGDEFEAKIINIDVANVKLEISKRELTPDPFETFNALYNKGDTVKGKAKDIKDFGVFVEISKNVEGLLHIYELSWTKRINHPKELFTTGDEIEVKILDVDLKKKKISLGYKQNMPNPWDTLDKQYLVNDIVSVTVENINKNFIFGLVDDEFNAVVTCPSEDGLSEKYPEGSKISGQVSFVNKAKRKVFLNLVVLSGDSWEDFKSIYQQGTSISGEVVESAEKGFNIKLPNDVVGFCHESQVGEEKVEIGQKTNFIIQNIDEKNKKVYLSIIEYKQKHDKNYISDYVNSSKDKSNITLGDFLN